MTASTIQGTVAEPLVAADRCDGCGAQAFMRATLDGLELLFCAHHGREGLPKLEASGFTIQDETHVLTEMEKPAL